MRFRVWSISVLAVSLLSLSACYEQQLPTDEPPPAGTGGFLDELVLKLDANGRQATLIESFTYVDSDEVEWTTPSSWVVDGASIPQALWGFIGGPFSGKYRNASVIHDFYCDTRTRTWQEVHRVFYDAMLASGVEPRKAATMYTAVYRFGPRWDVNMTVSDEDIVMPVSIGAYTPDFSEAAFESLESEIETGFEAGTLDQEDILAKTSALDEAVESEMSARIRAYIEASEPVIVAQAAGMGEEGVSPTRSLGPPPVLVIEDLNALP